MGTKLHNWRLALKDAQDAINSGHGETWAALSRQVGISKSTLQDGFRREYGIDNISQIKDYKPDELSNISFVEDDGASIKIDEHKDSAEIDFRTIRITTLEQMLAICKVDLDVWEVERYLVNKWEVGIKSKKVDLEWEDGKIIQGLIKSDGNVLVEPLYQIKVWLKRKNSLQQEGVSFQPVHINIQISKKSQPKRHGIKTVAIIPDMQIGFSTEVNNSESRLIPFHDRQAIDVALQVVEMEEIDTVVYLGDVLDLAEWTTHFLRSPDLFFNTQSSIIEAAWWLSQFRMSAQDSEQSYLEGNHELRLQTAVMMNLSAAYNIKPPGSEYPILSIPNLLNLNRLGINYIPEYPNNYVWIGENLVCTHGNTARSNPGATVAKIVDEHDTTIIQGHIHRIEMVSRTIHHRDESKVVHAFSPGCLCKIDGSVPGSSARSQWQQGVAVVYYDVESGNHTIVPIPIRHGMAIHRGYMLKSRDRIEEIRQDTNWNF